MRIRLIRNIQLTVLRIARLAIFSNVYISLAAVAFVAVNASMMDIPLYKVRNVLGQVFCSTMFVYQLSRWQFHRRAIEEPEVDAIYRFLENNKNYTRISIVLSFLGTLAFTLLLRMQTIAILVVLGGISILYPINIRWKEKVLLRLRDIPFLKLFLIAAVWSGSSVLLPAVELGAIAAIDEKVKFLFYLQFLFIFIITLPFDINDLRVDTSIGLRTLPSILGIRNCQILLSILTIIYSIGIFLWLWIYYSGTHIYYLSSGIIVLMFSQLYMTWRYSEEVSKWRIMLWYDGAMIWYVLIIAAVRLLERF